MPRHLHPSLLLLSFFFFTFSSCAPTPAIDAPYTPAFYYLALSPNATLVLLDKPGSTPRQSIPLPPPPDCSLYALHPAPRGRWIAVEWECVRGPAVELLDTANGQTHFALADASIDSRFLAWQPDGRALYLKIGTLSVPQTLRLNAATGQALEIPVSAFAYDLTVSPDSQRLLYSLSKGLGFGSETWLAGPNGENPSQLLLDPENIIALAQYSPNGRQIAYIKLPDNQVSAPPGELWVMDSDGQNAHFLATADAGRGFPPVWSPDGTKIAFVGRDLASDEKSINLSIYDLSSAALSTVQAALLTAPAWSPDGALIVYSSDKMELWFYEVSSGKISQAASGACCAGWIR